MTGLRRRLTQIRLHTTELTIKEVASEYKQFISSGEVVFRLGHTILPFFFPSLKQSWGESCISCRIAIFIVSPLYKPKLRADRFKPR